TRAAGACKRFKSPVFSNIQPVAFEPEINVVAGIQRQGGWHADRQALCRVNGFHLLRLPLHQSATRGPQPKIPLAIFKNGADIERPSEVPEQYGLEAVFGEANQSTATGSDPNTPIVSLAQTPNANRRRLIAAEMVEALSFGEVDQVSVAKGPQVALAIFV